uniref:Uncharacterized protein n=1 Tax=Anguilla anguilla TaxID=7936 RepID=A0A0E9RSL6_ANGAN
MTEFLLSASFASTQMKLRSAPRSSL